MKLTKSRLNRIIKEEIQKVLYEWPEGEAQLAPGKRDRKNRVEETQFDDQTGNPLDPEASRIRLNQTGAIAGAIDQFILAINNSPGARMEAYDNLARAIKEMGGWPEGTRQLGKKYTELFTALKGASDRDWGALTQQNLLQLIGQWK